MQWVRLLHLLGMAMWVGAFSSVGALGRQALGETEPAARKALWRAAVRGNGFALGGAAVAITTGLVTFFYFLRLNSYLKQPWMHGKLTLAVIFVALHVLVTLKVRRDAAATSSSASAPGAPAGSPGLYILANALGGPLAFGILFFVILRPWERLF